MVMSFEKAPGFSDSCYSPWSHKESDYTEQLNWTEDEENQQNEMEKINKIDKHQ